jgi:hypothetical protein
MVNYISGLFICDEFCFDEIVCMVDFLFDEIHLMFFVALGAVPNS